MVFLWQVQTVKTKEAIERLLSGKGGALYIILKKMKKEALTRYTN